MKLFERWDWEDSWITLSLAVCIMLLALLFTATFNNPNICHYYIQTFEGKRTPTFCVVGQRE